MASDDAEMQMEQQQHLIEQLKTFVRERDEALQNKEKELQEANSKLSKVRLQAKAKAVKKSKQAEEKAGEKESDKDVNEGASSSKDESGANKAKALVLKRKLEDQNRIITEKDEVIRVREGQLEAKERILAEKDTFVQDLTEQLEEKTKAMESMQQLGGGSGGDQNKIQEMIAQMVYKDKKVMEMNTKVLEQDKRIMDLQEFAGEKDQVIRGRDKVVEILQISIKEKDQANQDQALLIAKLTARVESTNEKVDEVSEKLRQKENELKSETDRFHIKLTESQKYFEEMLQDMEVESQKLKTTIEIKDKELVTRENDLRDLIVKHERDIETIMKKENINLQDHMIQMLEGKLKDLNDVLDGKAKATVALQKDLADKQKELKESQETMKLIKEKLQITSEQMMLLQANFVDKESQWSEERLRLEGKLKDTIEKHETEVSEKDLQVETLRSTLTQYEAAYAQASVQYNKLQEHYQQALAGQVDADQIAAVAQSKESAELESLRKELQESREKIDQLTSQVKSPESSQSDESSASNVGKGDAKLLKMKAQMTSRIKALEKELKELKQKGQPQGDVTALKESKEQLEQKLADFEVNMQALDQMKVQNEELKAAVDSLTEEKTRAQDDLCKVVKEKESQEHRLSEITAAQESGVETHTLALEEAKTVLHEVENERDELKLKSEELSKMCQELENRNKDTLAKMDGLSQELASFTEREEKITQQMNEAVSNTEKLEIVKAGLEDEMAKLVTEKDGLETSKDTVLQVMEKENQEMKEMMRNLEESLASYQSDAVEKDEFLKSMESKAKELESNLAKTREDLKVKTEEMINLQAEKESLDEKLDENIKIAENLQQDIEIISTEKSEGEKELNRLTTEIGNIQSELDASIQQLESLKEEMGAEVDKLKSKNDMLSKEVSEKSESLQDALNKLGTANEEVATLKDSLEGSSDRCTQQELEVKKLLRELDVSREGQTEKGREFEGKMETLLSQISDLEAEVSSQQKHVHNQETLIADLKNSLSMKEDELKKVCHELSDSKSYCENVQRELDDTVKKLHLVESSVDAEKVLNSELHENISSREEDIRQLKQHVTERDEKIKHLEDDKNTSMDAVTIELRDSQSRLESTKQSLSELESILESKNSEMEVLNQKCDLLQEQVISISNDLDSSKSQVTEFKEINDSLKYKLDDYQQKLLSMSESLEEDSVQTQQVISQLQQEKETQDELVNSLERQLVSLEAEVKASRSTSAEKDTQIAILESDLTEGDQRSDSLQSSLVSVQKTQAQADQKVLEDDYVVKETQPQVQATCSEAPRNDTDLVEEAMILKLESEKLKSELDSLKSSLSSLEEQRDKAVVLCEELEKTVKKKDKVIQGLHLKAKKIAKQTKQAGDGDTSISNSPMKSKEHRVLEAFDRARYEGDPFMSMSWSDSQQDLSTLTQEEKSFRQLVSQYQNAVFEKDTFKDLLAEKDTEIMRLQTQFYESELSWKESLEKYESKLEQLEKLQDSQFDDTSKDVGDFEKPMVDDELSHKLEDATRKLNAATELNETYSKTISDYEEKFEALQQSVNTYYQGFCDKETSLQESTMYVQQLQDYIGANQQEFQNQIQACNDEKSHLENKLQRLEYEIEAMRTIETQKEQSTNSQDDDVIKEASLTADDVRQDQIEMLKQEMKAEMETRDNKISVMESIMKEMYGTQDENSTRIGHLSAELDKMINENESYIGKVSELQKTLKKKDAKIAAMTKRINSQKSQPDLDSSFVKSQNESLDESVQSQNTSFVEDGASVEDRNVEKLRAEVSRLKKSAKKKDAQLLVANKKLQQLSEQDKLHVAPSVESVADSGDKTLSHTSNSDSRSTLFTDDVHDIYEKLRQSESARDSCDASMRELEIKFDGLQEENLNLRHEIEDAQEEIHFLARDKRALENCIFDIKDLVNTQMVEQLAGEDLLYSTAESVRLTVEEKVAAEKRLADLEAWFDETDKSKQTLQGELEESKEMINMLQLEVDPLKEAWKNTYDQLEKVVNAKSVLEEEHDSLKLQMEQMVYNSEKEDLQNLLKESSVIVKTLQKEKDDLKEDGELLLEQLQDLKAAHQRLVSENKTQLNQAQTHLHQLQEENEAMALTLKTSCDECSQLQSYQKQSEEYISQLGLRLSDMENTFSSQITELSNKLSRAEKDCDTLRETNQGLSNELEDYQNEVQGLESTIESLQAFNQNSKEESYSQQVNLSNERDELVLKVNDLRTMLKAKENKLSSLSAEHDELAILHEKLEADLTKALDRNLSAQSQIDQLKMLLTQKQVENDRLYQDLNHQHSIITQMKEDNQVLHHEFAQKMVEETTMVKRNIEQEKELSENEKKLLQEEVEKLRHENEQLCEHSSELDSKYRQEREQLQNQLMGSEDYTKQMLGNLEKDLEVKVHTISQLENEISMMAEKAKQTSEMEASFSVLQKEFASSKESINSLEQQLITERSAAAHHIQSCEEELVTIKTATAEKEESVILSEQQKDQICQLGNQLSQLQEENNYLKTQISQLENHAQKSIVDFEEYKSKIEAYEAEVKNNQNMIMSQETEISNLRLQLAEWKDMNDTNVTALTDGQNKCKHLEADVLNIKSVADNKTDEIASLSSHIENLKQELSFVSGSSNSKDLHLSELTQELKSLLVHKDEMQQRIDELQLNETQLLRELEMLKSEKMSLEEKLNDSSSTGDSSSETNLTELSTKVKAQQVAMKKKDAKIVSITKKLQSSQENVEELKERLALLSAASEQMPASSISQLNTNYLEKSEYHLDVMQMDSAVPVYSSALPSTEYPSNPPHEFIGSENVPVLHTAHPLSNQTEGFSQQDISLLQQSLEDNTTKDVDTVAELQRLTQALEAAEESNKNQVLTLSDSLKESESRLEQAEQARDAAEKKVADLEQKEEEMKSSPTEKETFDEKIMALEQDNDDLTARVRDLEVMIADEKEYNVQQSKRAESIENELGVRATSQTANALVENLKVSCSEKENEIEALREDLSTAERVCTDKHNQIEALSEDCQNFQTMKEAFQAELTSKISEIDAQKTRFDEERNRLAFQIESLTSSLNDQELQSEELSILKLKWQEVEQERLAMLEKIAGLEANAERMVSLEEEIAELQSVNSILSQQSETGVSDVEALRLRAVQLESELGLVTGKQIEAEGRCNDALKSLEIVTEEKETLSSEMKALYEQVVVSSTKVAELEEKLRDQKSAQTSKDKDLEEINLSNDRLNNEIQSMSHTIEDKEIKIQSLLNNLKEMEDRLVQVDEEKHIGHQEDEEKGASTSAESESLKQALDKKQGELQEKELVAKKAIATAKKLKYQLTQANKSLEETKGQIEELKKANEQLETKLSNLGNSNSVTTPSDQVQVETEASIKGGEEPVQEIIPVEEEMIQTSANSSLNLSAAPGSFDTSLELESLQTQLATYKECCEELQKQFQSQTESLFEMESKLKQKQTVIDELEGVKDGLKLTISELETSFQNLQDSHESLQTVFTLEREELEKKCEISDEQARQWKSFVDCLKQEHASQDEKIQQLTKDLDRLHLDAADVSLLRSSVEEKDEKVMHLMTQLEADQTAMQTIENTKKDLEQQVESSEEIIESLKSNIKTLGVNQSEYETALSRYKDLIEEKESEFQTLNNDLKDLRPDKDLQEQNSQTQILDLRQHVEDSKVRLEELTTTLEQSQRERDNEKATSDSLRDELKSNEMLIGNLNDAIVQLKVELEETQSKISKGDEEDLANLQSTLSQVQEQIKEQGSLISTMEKSMSSEEEAVEEGIVPTQGEEVDLKDDLIKYQNMVEELNLELSALKDQQLEKVKKMDSENAEELKLLLEQTMHEKQALEAEKEKLQSDTDQQLEVTKRMQEVISEKLSQVEDVQAAYEKLQTVVSALNNEKQELLFSMDSSRGELEGMEQVVVQLRMQETDAREHAMKLAVENDELSEKLRNAQSELLKSQEEISTLKSSNKVDGADEKSVEWAQRVVEEAPMEAVEQFQQTSAPQLFTGVQSPARPEDSLIALQLAENEDILTEVRSQLDKTKGKLQVAEVKCEKMLIKLKNFKEKNDKLQTQVDQLQQAEALKAGGSPQRDGALREERRRLEEQVFSLQNKLREVETHSGKLFHENSTLKTQLKELEGTKSLGADLQNTTEELNRKEEECIQSKSTIDSLKQELKSFQNELDSARSLLHDKTVECQENSRLKEDLIALEDDLANLHEQLDAERKGRREEKALFDKENNQGKADLGNVMGQLDQLREELEVAERKRREESKRADEALKEVNRLQSSLENKHKSKEMELNSEVSSLQSRLETLTDQYDTLSVDNDNYQDLVATLTKTNSSLKHELDVLKFSLKSSENSNQGSQDLKASSSELTQRLQDAEQERDNLMEEFEELREEAVSLRREKMSLTQQINDLTTSVEQLNATIGQMSSQHVNEGDENKTRVNRSHDLDEELEKLTNELSASLEANKELRNEINGLNWKLEEAGAFEQEVEDLQSELSSAAMEKKILIHDLEEARGELTAIQTDKHLLMDEVERLGEKLEAAITKVKYEEESSSLHEKNTKVEELSEQTWALQDTIDKQNDKIKLYEEKVSILQDDLNEKDSKLLRAEEVERSMAALQENVSVLQIENKTLRKKLDNFNLKIDTVRSLEADFESLNIDFTKVLEEKSEMAYQIEQLHARIQGLMSKEHEVTFSVQQQEHVLREKEMLQQRVEQLEGTEGSSMAENAALRGELEKLKMSWQQVEFEKNSLQSQLQLVQSEGSTSSKFQEEHVKLQGQFAQVMEQKNSVALELNQALHSLKQSQHRCQQTAAQVSQLAEDRGYLNTQLSTISKSLREKEQEWLAIRQQYGDLYQEYIASQAKVAELERRIALDLMQKEIEEEETAAEADQVHAHNVDDTATSTLVELQQQHTALEGTFQALQETLTRERAIKDKLEKDLNEAHDQIQLLASAAGARDVTTMHIQMEDEDDIRIRETTAMLTRQGMGYLSRIQSWLRTKNRQLNRAMRLRPGLRTVIWIYFVFLHLLIMACMGGFL